MKVDLRGNVKSIGTVYATYATGVQGRSLWRRTVTVEDVEPWRRGQGVGVLLFPGLVLTVGRWRPDEDPNLQVEAREAAEVAHHIPTWAHLTTLTLDDEPVAPSGWTIIPLEGSA